MPSPESFPLNRDFADLLRELSAAQARFLIVGAYALAVHGVPRATGDIDVWVEPTRANAERVMSALRKFGAPVHDLSIEDLAHPETVYQLGVTPHRIDLMTTASGLKFATAWKTQVSARFGDLTVPVLGRASLVRNKRATGRPKDLLDLESLRESPGRRRRGR